MLLKCAIIGDDRVSTGESASIRLKGLLNICGAHHQCRQVLEMVFSHLQYLMHFAFAQHRCSPR